jgi:hypothetical protein
MNITLTASVMILCLLGAVWIGTWIRRLLPEKHLSADTKDTVKLSVGLVATMSALVLGLLVSSAKSSYDTTRGEVLQMAAKIAFLDRVLSVYGPESESARIKLRALVEQVVSQMWSREEGGLAQFGANTAAGDALYGELQALSPKTDSQRSLKAQAISNLIELGQLRSLLVAQSVPSISKPLLFVVIGWLIVILIGFGTVAPPNATAIFSLWVAAISVAGAVVLILELDRPLNGAIHISSEPMQRALVPLKK